MNQGTTWAQASNQTPVLPADFPDAHSVTLMIAQAFHPLAVTNWLVPDARERARALYAFFRVYVDHAMEYGQVWMTGRRGGVSVWFIRDGLPTPEIEDYDHRLRLACGPHADRFRILAEELDKHYPKDPHQHLAFLAVNPFRQSAGLGTALLNHHHEELDRAGIAAYLVAGSQRNRMFHHRHGYVELGEPIQLPDGPTMWPMWREPQPISDMASAMSRLESDEENEVRS